MEIDPSAFILAASEISCAGTLDLETGGSEHAETVSQA